MGRLRLAVWGFAGILAIVSGSALSRADVEKSDKSVKKETPWLGIVMGAGSHGVEILEVIPMSPAEAAGLEAGDQLFEFDGQAVTSFRHLKTLVEASAVGADVSMRVWRNGAKRTLFTTLATRLSPEEIFHSRLFGKEPPKLDAKAVWGDAGADLSLYKGDLVLVAFWGNKYNGTSAAWLAKLVEKYGDNGLIVMAISARADYWLAEQGEQNDAPFTILADPENKTHKIYGVGLHSEQAHPPIYMLVGRDGTVVYGGSDSKSKCKSALETALRERNGLSVE